MAENEHLADNGVIFIGNDLPYPDFNYRRGVIFSGFDVIFRLHTALRYISDGKADDLLSLDDKRCHHNYENAVTFFIGA